MKKIFERIKAKLNIRFVRRSSESTKNVKRIEKHFCLSCGDQLRTFHTENFDAPTYIEFGRERHHTKFIGICLNQNCIENGKEVGILEYEPEISIKMDIS